MTGYLARDTVHIGDVRELAGRLEPASVQTIVTSPPYFGLRDYGTATWEGGDAECDHLRPVQPRNSRPLGSFHSGTDDGNYAREPQYKGTCAKCGAARVDRQLGMEATPEEYVANLVAVFAALLHSRPPLRRGQYLLLARDEEMPRLHEAAPAAREGGMSDFDPTKHLRRLRGKGGDADYLDGGLHA